MAIRQKTITRDEATEKDVIKYIDNYFFEPLSIEGYAMSRNLPVRTIQRSLKACGTNWRALVTERRMKEAYNLVTKTTTPIADISLVVGYVHPHSFVTQFRRKFGQLPSALRREAHGIK